MKLLAEFQPLEDDLDGEIAVLESGDSLSAHLEDTEYEIVRVTRRNGRTRQYLAYFEDGLPGCE